jgi:uncharacterized membrane protein YkoI
MQRKTNYALASVAIVVASVGAASAAVAASSDDETDPPIVGSELDQASRAALAATAGGRVTETEVGDEDSYYEVEVTLDDGRQVDVQLDEQFKVVQVMDDSEGAGQGSAND